MFFFIFQNSWENALFLRNSKVFWKIFWNSSKNFGILEFPRKFKKKIKFWNFLENSKIPKFFGRCFGILGKTLELWNFLGNSKKKDWNFGISSKIPKFQNSNFFLEFSREFQNSKDFFGISQGIPKFQSFFWNFLGNSKISKFFFWNFPGNSKIPFFFWNFLGNSKIPIFFLEFQNIFQKILEFWNFLGNSKIPKKKFGIS